jgi:hypothetical protein
MGGGDADITDEEEDRDVSRLMGGGNRFIGGGDAEIADEEEDRDRLADNFLFLFSRMFVSVSSFWYLSYISMKRINASFGDIVARTLNDVIDAQSLKTSS